MRGGLGGMVLLIGTLSIAKLPITRAVERTTSTGQLTRARCRACEKTTGSARVFRAKTPRKKKKTTKSDTKEAIAAPRAGGSCCRAVRDEPGRDLFPKRHDNNRNFLQLLSVATISTIPGVTSSGQPARGPVEPLSLRALARFAQCVGIEFAVRLGRVSFTVGLHDLTGLSQLK